MSWNTAAERLFGYAPDEVIGQPVAMLAPGGWAIDQQAQMRSRLLAGGPPEHLETTRRRKDGTIVEVLMTASTATDRTGKMMGFATIAHDMTEHRAERRALQASERRLAEAQPRRPHRQLRPRSRDRRTHVVRRAVRILGLKPGVALSDEAFLSMVHPDDVAAVRRAWFGALKGGIPFDPGNPRDPGGVGWNARCEHGLFPIVVTTAPLCKVAGTMLDDTDLVAADRVRQAAENRFEIGFEQSAIGAVIADLAGIPFRVNPAMRAPRSPPEQSWWGGRGPSTPIPTRCRSARPSPPGWRRARTPTRTSGGTCDPTAASCGPSRTSPWCATTGPPQYFFTQLQNITGRKHWSWTSPTRCSTTR